MSDLTAERLRELLHYDPETGLFVWRVRSSSRAGPGDAAGRPDKRGYMWVGIDRRVRSVHRLAWLYVHGSWPLNEIDHIDGDKGNNRIENLRDVTRSTNQQNFRVARRGTRSGLLGAWMHPCGRWTSQIVVDGQRRHLGLFDTPEQAHAAYLAAKRSHHAGCTI
jgi:hypothetical protein